MKWLIAGTHRLVLPLSVKGKRDKKRNIRPFKTIKKLEEKISNIE